MQPPDADHRAAPEAGDRPGAGCGDGGRVPAGGDLRSRGRVERGALRDARRQYRAVLLDAHGGAVARRPAQGRAWRCCSPAKPSTREEARRIGLVNRVVAPGDLEKETDTLARYIASKPTATLKLGKLAFQHQIELGVSGAYDYVGEVMVQNMLARRKPRKASARFWRSARRNGRRRSMTVYPQLFRRADRAHPAQREDHRHGRRQPQRGAPVLFRDEVSHSTRASRSYPSIPARRARRSWARRSTRRSAICPPPSTWSIFFATRKPPVRSPMK